MGIIGFEDKQKDYQQTDSLASVSGLVCQWKPFWIPVGESFQNAYLEEWIYMGDDSSDEQSFANFPALVQSPGNKGHISKTKLRDDAPSALKLAEQPDALPWEPLGILLGKN